MADLLVVTAAVTTITLASTAAAGLVADRPEAVAGAWKDGRDQVAAWVHAGCALVRQAGPVLTVVEVRVLELVLRPHGRHRRGVA